MGFLKISCTEETAVCQESVLFLSLSSASCAIRNIFNLCLRYRLALAICLVRKQSGIGDFIYQVSLTEII